MALKKERFKLPNETKAYIGDGVYVELENDTVKLTSENGIQVLDKIYLEPSVLADFQRWIEKHKLK